MPAMKQIRLNAFEMNTVGHQSPGLWAHPRDRSACYTDLDYWTGLARTLERGRFDGIFLADVLGIYDVYGGSPDAALRHAVQVPVGDPMLLVPAMAAVTEHLGFGITCTLSYEPPYTLARRLSTLDHLTRGRAGWNIVTGYLDSAATGMGLAVQPRHDQRYELAEEYMQVMYRLWEGSWEDGAALRDRERRVFADPAKIHRVRHEGQFYRLDAIHLCEPSPQRTPVLYQAGASSRGRDFAARHAECVFINGPSARVVAPQVADLRRRAAAHGRDPGDLLIFTLCTVITGRSEAEARAKHEEYRRYADPEAALALFSGWTGVDFSPLPARRRAALHRDRGDALGAGLVHLRRPGPGLDRARIGRACRDRRPRPAIRRLAGADRRYADRVGRGDRRRRVQPGLCGDPGELRGFCRPGRAGIDAARRLQDASTGPAPTARSCSAPARISRRRIRR